MSLYIDPYDKDLPTKVFALKPYKGYCFIIDIKESTELKDIEISKWIIFIYNTFANIMGNLFMKFKPIKSLGDALMFYIPEDDMQGETAMTLYMALWNIVNTKEEHVREVNIGAAYCERAYDITFVPDSIDIYGKDIDLTGRLMSIASSGEIVINSLFADRIFAEFKACDDKVKFAEVTQIRGPWPKMMKGFKDYVDIYKATS